MHQNPVQRHSVEMGGRLHLSDRIFRDPQNLSDQSMHTILNVVIRLGRSYKPVIESTLRCNLPPTLRRSVSICTLVWIGGSGESEEHRQHTHAHTHTHTHRERETCLLELRADSKRFFSVSQQIDLVDQQNSWYRRTAFENHLHN